MTKWAQELLWVKRNDRGVIVGMKDKPPEDGDFVPTLLGKEGKSNDRK